MRLTEKDYCGYDIKDRKNFNGYNEQEDCEKLFSTLQKLGQLEDILEKYNINNNEELEILCKYAESVREWMSIYKDKMYKIRDIEEELGIDLITLFKILKRKRIYCVDKYDKKIHQMIMYGECDLTGILVYEKGFEYPECARHLSYKEFGKTWALTKEELL